MQWTVQLEAMTEQGEVNRTELLTFSRPAMAGTLAEVGLTLAEAKALLATLQASMLCGQVAEYAAACQVCPVCGVLQPLKDRRSRRLQTLFGTVAVEAPRIRVLPMPLDRTHDGDGVLAGLRAAHRPLHAGAGAGAGRARGAHLVP